MTKKLMSIVSATFNEEDNVQELYERILTSIQPHIEQYNFEIIVIDNSSTDSTFARLKAIAVQDRRLKIIVNNRNFGHIRSPYYGIMQAQGEAVIYLASDLQDPPELIPQFIEQWEMGWKVIYAVKPTSQTSATFHLARRVYYRLLHSISEVELVSDTTGFGLYDKALVNHLRQINDPYPYLRGLVCELGYPIKTLPFEQPARKRGFSKNNIYTLYDIAMLGIVSHSMVPLRMAGMLGISIATCSFMAAIFYLTFKLVRWDSFPVGVAPLIIANLFLLGLILLFLSILGEYVGSMHTYLRGRPIVTERERVNFD
jgi:dolichol-phosphate mannosyltransferase